MSKAFDSNHFISAFHEQLPFTPTSDQEQVIRGLSDFVAQRTGRDVYVLKGYAGTGKTNLVSALANILPTFKWKSVLLAPTGRAAKVLSMYSKRPAQTIHKKIFRKAMSPDGGMYFSLGENGHTNTIFIVDEASMIGLDSSSSQHSLQDGLLESLFEYIFSGDNCKVLIVGDTAQLPPVGSDDSPALNIQYLRSAYHLEIKTYELKQVARQSLESGILQNATNLRQRINEEQPEGLPRLFLTKDVIKLEGDEVLDALNTAYSQYGYADTLVVTRSNKRANLFNQAVRARIRYMEDDICGGDLLMVVKNNYFWLEENSDAGFIANGDALEIVKIVRREEIYGFHFLECVVKLIDYPALPEIQLKVMLESINSETSTINPEQQQKLFEEVMADVA
ncbi:MAG: ATP-dependent DNA helicase, partial [Bacteroidia bacterium]